MAAANPRIAVGEEQVVELKGHEGAKRCPESSLHGLGIIAHQLVRHEVEWPVAIADQSIREGKDSAVSRDQQRGVVRAERADLQRVDAAGKPIAEVVRLQVLASNELAKACLVAPDRAAEPLLELPAVPVVQAIRQDDVSRSPLLGNLLHSFRRHARVEQHAERGQEVRADPDLVLLVESRPMEHTG